MSASAALASSFTMKAIIISFATLIAGANAQVNVAALGSSYAFGANLARPYGGVLADQLASAKGVASKFSNIAVSGSQLPNITLFQAAKLKNVAWNAVVITSGGNDLNYVGCLSNPNDTNACQPSLTQVAYNDRWAAALDAVFQNLPTGASQPPVYIVTYPRFLGNYLQCSWKNADCPLSVDNVIQVGKVYNQVVDWTIAAVSAWRNTTATNKAANLRILPMRSFSKGHEIGSGLSFINGKLQPAAGNGTSYHPTQLAANFIGTSIYNNLMQTDNNPAVP